MYTHMYDNVKFGFGCNKFNRYILKFKMNDTDFFISF